MLAVPLRATALVSQSADTTVSGNSPRKSHALLQRAVGEPVSHLRSCNSSFEDSSPLIPHHVIMCLIDQLLIHSIVGDFFAVTCTGRGLQWERVCYVLWKEIWETPVHGCTWTRNPQHSLANRHTQLLKLVKMKSENRKNHQKWGPRWCDMNSLCARLSKKTKNHSAEFILCLCWLWRRSDYSLLEMFSQRCWIKYLEDSSRLLHSHRLSSLSEKWKKKKKCNQTLRV